MTSSMLVLKLGTFHNIANILFQIVGSVTFVAHQSFKTKLLDEFVLRVTIILATSVRISNQYFIQSLILNRHLKAKSTIIRFVSNLLN